MWLSEVLGNPELMIDWLKKQYHGEVTAAGRIRTFAREYAHKNRDKRVLEIIASQEELHAAWVAELLVSRGIVPEVLVKDERYWNETLPGISDFHSGAAVASHAERMRLDRIHAICVHTDTPDDIREVFLKILPQEEFHERAFGDMAGQAALVETNGAHERGLHALGLVI
jgi:rubrerythrin